MAADLFIFGELLFPIHPGMFSIGKIGVVGIALSLFAALLLLPALLKIMESKSEPDHKKMNQKRNP